MARRQLPLGGPDLPPRQPPVARAAARGAHQAAAARPLGHVPRAQPGLRPHEPGHPRARPGGDVRDRPRARRPRHRRQRLARGDLFGGLPGGVARRGGHAAPVPPVLLPGRHPEPRRARDAGVDPRGRRAGLRALARLRGGLRQPGPGGLLRRRRRRGRDGGDGHELALEQAARSRRRRRRAADPAPQRVEDRQPHDPGPHLGGGAAGAAGRVRPPGHRGRGLRARRRASPDGRRAGRGPGRDRPDPARGPRGRRAGAAGLAHDRAAHPQGLDRPGRGQRGARGGDLPRPPGAPRRPGREAGAPAHAGGVDALVRPAGAVRRGRHPDPRDHRPGPGRRAAHERQPARQRRVCCCDR